MKFAIAQMDVIPGDAGRNFATMQRMIAQAKGQGADLIIFPELCVGGYLLGDKWTDESWCDELMQYNELLLEESKGIAIVYGNIFRDAEVNARWKNNAAHPNKDGRTRKYNAAYVMQDGKYAERVDNNDILPVGIQPKTLLPVYRIFDDERYFFSLPETARDAGMEIEKLVSPFWINVRGKKIKLGVEVCEDMWCGDYRMNNAPLSVSKILLAKGAELLVNISASPWDCGKELARDGRVKFLYEDSGKKFAPFIYVNNTGVQNNGKNIVVFDGRSTVYNSKAQPVHFSSAHSEKLEMFEEAIFNSAAIERKKEKPIAQKFNAIVEGIRHLQLFRAPADELRFVIGLSGGVDSAVVAALLVQACGKKNVLAVNMPSRYNSSKTKNAAKKIAQKLGITLLDIPVDELSDLNKEIFREMDAQFDPPAWRKSLSDENIQAKVRGTSILSNIAGRYGMFMTNNGNKLEVALGYATLYGDVNGSIAPIADLTKTEVYALGKYLNGEIFKEEVLPAEFFPADDFQFDDEKIFPSAELKNNQVDPMKFGYHCALLDAYTSYIKRTPEEVLQWYLDGSMEENLCITHSLLERWNITDPSVFVEDLGWFTATIQRNVFKRVQSPPVIITSRSAYGYDIRESMLPWIPSKKFLALKEQVLQLSVYRSKN